MAAGLPEGVLDEGIDGEPVLLDADAGLVDLAPSPELAKDVAADVATVTRAAKGGRAGMPVLLAEAESVAEVAAALAAGAQGIGLVRTERLYSGAHLPDEAQQAADYAALLAAAGGYRVTIRTLALEQNALPRVLSERLPAGSAGLRGIGLALHLPDLLDTQLRALATLGADANLQVLIPSVSTPEEWTAARTRWHAMGTNDGVSIGPMLETPAAALEPDAYLDGAGCVSVGTNDLLTSVYGVSRDSAWPALDDLWLQPAWLRLIRRLAHCAHARALAISICGVMAADPLGALLLAGLGVDALTVPVWALASVSAALASPDAVSCVEVATACCAARALSDVRALLADVTISVYHR